MFRAATGDAAHSSHKSIPIFTCPSRSSSKYVWPSPVFTASFQSKLVRCPTFLIATFFAASRSVAVHDNPTHRAWHSALQSESTECRLHLCLSIHVVSHEGFLSPSFSRSQSELICASSHSGIQVRLLNKPAAHHFFNHRVLVQQPDRDQ